MKLKRLHYLRGLAALLVAFSHIPHWRISTSPSPGGGFDLCVYMIGTVAVWVFFAISGFLMAEIYANRLGQPGCLREYVIKRAFRIFPAYWFFLASTVVLYATTSLPRWGNLQFPISFGRSLSALTLLPFSSDAANLLPNDWTLYHEMGFYLVLGTVILSRRIGVLIAVTYFIISVFYSKQIFFCIAIVNVYFLSGVVVAVAVPRLRLARSVFIFVTFLAILLLGSVVLTRPLGCLHIFNLLAGLCGVPLLLIGLVGLDRSETPVIAVSGIVGPILGYLGDVSYSLYLGHTLLQGALYLLIGVPDTWFGVAAYGIVPSLLVYPAFRFIEKPAMERARLLCGHSVTWNGVNGRQI